MKLLVTGGCGFIGSNFIINFLDLDPSNRIINIDKLTYAGNERNLASIPMGSRYHLYQLDICTRTFADWITDLMSVSDGIIHFAAESHVDRSIESSRVFVHTNVYGTVNLLECLRKLGKKIPFVYISTDEVYGALKLNEPEKFDETTPFAPRSPYAASKAAADMLCQTYKHTYGMDIRITRCSNNYGRFQFPEKFIPVTIYSILNGKKVPVYGDGLYVRDWIHVKDHCSAIYDVLVYGPPGGTFNVGADNERSNLEIVKIICSYLGRDPNEVIEYIADRPGHDRRYAIDASKLIREVGWEPQIPFEVGIEETIDWYKNNKGWWNDTKFNFDREV